MTRVIHKPKAAVPGSGHSVRLLRWKDHGVSLSMFSGLVMQIRHELDLPKGIYLGFRPVMVDTMHSQFVFEILELEHGAHYPDIFKPGSFKRGWATSSALEGETFGLEAGEEFVFKANNVQFHQVKGQPLRMYMSGGLVEKLGWDEGTADEVTVDESDPDVYCSSDMDADRWTTVKSILATNNRKTNRTTVDIVASALTQAGVLRTNGLRRK